MDSKDIKRIIEAGLPGCTATVEGDGRHFTAVVVCEAFAGKSMLQQHKMVYEAIGERMPEIHALSIRTLIPGGGQQAGGDFSGSSG